MSDEELAYLGSGVGACSDRFRYFTKKRAYSSGLRSGKTSVRSGPQGHTSAGPYQM